MPRKSVCGVIITLAMLMSSDSLAARQSKLKVLKPLPENAFRDPSAKTNVSKREKRLSKLEKINSKRTEAKR